MVICLERGADLHMAQLMPLPLTVSCYSKIQIGFTFLVPADPGSPGKKAVKCVCVCVCVCGACTMVGMIVVEQKRSAQVLLGIANLHLGGITCCVLAERDSDRGQ